MANDSELENDTKLEDDPKLENDPKEKSLIVTQLGKILEKPGLNEQDKAFINAVKEKQTIQEKQIASLTEGHNYILKKQGEMEYDKKNKDEQIKNLTGELAALKGKRTNESNYSKFSKFVSQERACSIVLKNGGIDGLNFATL
uniref:Uncharacterized protein n=1 Tax=Meloidogyne floridensis TaxID=298350 RepID=A0A915P917_9BILA